MLKKTLSLVLALTIVVCSMSCILVGAENAGPVDHVVGAVTGNMFSGTVTGGNMDINSTSISAVGDANTKSVVFTAAADIASSKHGFGANKMGAQPLAVSAGDTLLLKLRVKSTDTTKTANVLAGFSNTIYKANLFYANNEEAPSTAKSFSVTSEEYQEYISVTKVPESFTAEFSTAVPLIYYVKGTQKGAQVVLDGNASGIYYGKEYARDLKITAESGTTVLSATGGSVLLDADVFNQLDIKGNLSQDVTWTAYNADRTAVASTIETVKGEDGAVTVNVAAGTPAGTYDIVASYGDNQLVRGVKIDVVGVPTEDTVPGEISGNMFTGFVTAGNMDINSVDVSAVGDAGYKLVVFTANKNITSGKVGFGGNKMGAQAISVTPGENLLLKLRVKNTDITKTAKILVGFSSDIYSGVQFYAPAEGFSVTSSEYQDYITCVTVPETYTSATAIPNIYFIAGTQEGAKVVIDGDASNIYYGKEYVRDLKVTAKSGTTVLSATGGNILLDADVYNQFDMKGGLSQDVSWMAYNADRSATVDTIGFTYGEDGAVAVNVAAGTPAGTYDIVAVYGDNQLVKGVEIQVAAAAPEDTVPGAISGNMFTGSVTAGNMDINSVDISAVGDANSKLVVLTANKNIASGRAGFGANKMGAQAISVVPGDTVLLKLRVKNTDTTKTAKILAGFASGIYSGTKFYAPSEGFNVTSDEYQEYITYATVPETYTSATAVPDIYYIAGTQEGAKVVLDANALNVYYGKEYANDITITANSKTSVLSAVGGTIQLDADVLNQLNITGGLSQDVTWIAYNADRTAIADSIGLVKGDDGAVAVNVAAGTPAGTYDIVASYGDNQVVKGIKIHVVGTDSEQIPLSDNMFKGTVTAGNMDINSADISAVGDANTNTVVLTANKNITSGRAGFGANKMGAQAVNVKPGDILLLKLRVKSADTTKTAKILVGFATGIYSSAQFYAPSEGFSVTSSEYQEYVTFVRVPNTYSATTAVPNVYYISGTQEGAKVVLDCNASVIYYGKEYASSIDITTENANVVAGKGGNVSLKADVVNQLGITGGLLQEVTWFALNADKSDYVDYITFEEDEYGVVTAANVSADAPAGTYHVLALSESYGLVKSAVITVTEAKEGITAFEITEANGVVALQATVSHTEAEEILFVVASYTNEGKLVDAIPQVIPVVNNTASTDNLTLSGVADGDIVRGFVWENGTYRPVAIADGVNVVPFVK